MCAPKGESWSQGFLAETVETGDKNRDVSLRHASFGEESLEEIDAKYVELFRNGSGHEFYRMKALITLEQVNISVKTSLVRLQNSSGVVNFHFMQMSLVMNMQFVFGDD